MHYVMCVVAGGVLPTYSVHPSLLTLHLSVSESLGNVAVF